MLYETANICFKYRLVRKAISQRYITMPPNKSDRTLLRKASALDATHGISPMTTVRPTIL
jgi:hypothetical protein